MWKHCTLFQKKTPTRQNGRHTQSYFDFAEGNRVKNTTIKIRFIAEKLHLLALRKNKIPIFYSVCSEKCCLLLTQVLVLEM